MAVTRHCYSIWLGDAGRSELMARLQQRLNEKLGSNERIVYAGPSADSPSTWNVVTEELIMGPTP